MSDLSLTEPALTEEIPHRPRQLLAIVLSCVVPGVGHFLVGQKRKACVLLAVLFVLLIGFWPLRLLRFPWGFVLLCLGWATLYLYAACDVATVRLDRPGHRFSKWWLFVVIPIALVGANATSNVMARVSGFRLFSIPSSGMEDTIRKGDYIVVDSYHYPAQTVQRQRIIVFLRGNIYSVKRVVAVGGDSVRGFYGDIFVNGARLDEPYAVHQGGPLAGMQDFGPIIVPPGFYFVVGDNRDASFDSRSPELGPVSAHSVLGVTLYVLNRRGFSVH